MNPTYETTCTVNGTEYRVTVFGHGIAIAVNRVDFWESGFFAQGDDATEYVECLDEHGPVALVNSLLGAWCFEGEG